MAKKNRWGYTAGVRQTDALMFGIEGARYGIPIGVVCFDNKPLFTITEEKSAETYDKTRALVDFLNTAGVMVKKGDSVATFLGKKFPASVMCG